MNITVQEKYNFPLLKTFDVDSEITNFLNLKFDEYFQHHDLIPAENIVYVSETGGYTMNLLEWKNIEYQKFLNSNIIDVIAKCLDLSRDDFYLHYNHMFDYACGGYVKEHKHDHAEDYVFIFYLNDCSTGETVFFLNNHNEIDKQRTSIRVYPNKNRGVCFSSMLFHKAEYTNEAKKIFVVGVKLKIA